jgi:hypothetical protein
MVKKIVVFSCLFLSLVGLRAQDILLTLGGKEVPCIINKVDTFFVFYTPLGPVESIEKSLISKITPQKLVLKDGSEKEVVFDRASFDANGPYVFYREKGKKERRKDRYNYFSCTVYSFDTLLPYQDSIPFIQTEKVLYAQDSLHKKFELTDDEQRAYTYGRRSARKNFTSPWSTLGGIASGLTGGIILNFFYAAAPAIAYTVINVSIRPKVGATDLRDQPYVSDELFIEGYRNQARMLKVQNSILGAVPSLAIGMLLRYFMTIK